MDEPICAFRKRRAEAAAFQIPEPMEVCQEAEASSDFGGGRPVDSSDDSGDEGIDDIGDDSSDDIGDEGFRRILSKKERLQRRKELRSRKRSLSDYSEPDNGGAGDSDSEGSISSIVDFIIDILQPDEEEFLPAGDEEERNC